jgi:hypothetical protein
VEKRGKGVRKMLALEIIGVLGAVYTALVWVLVRTRLGRKEVQLKKTSPATTGGAW